MLLKKLIFIIIFLPIITHAHPGIGIVKDSKGNIYYSDLQRVWKISGGKKTVVVPNVHTHELYIDKGDKLFGEGGYYDSGTQRFYHYLWVLHQSGHVDTVVGMKEDFIHVDFSFARDKNGNEYYTKQFLKTPDANHIYKRTLGGKETVFAKGNFKGVVWLHPQGDGTLLYVQKNALYSVDRYGNIQLIKSGIGNAKPSFTFSGNNITNWGVWKDSRDNIYIAAFSDQAVKKIDSKGTLSVVYQSTGNWTPLHGLFDNNNRLWVLEGSDKNEVRVTATSIEVSQMKRANSRWSHTAIVGCLLLFGMLVILRAKNVF